MRYIDYKRLQSYSDFDKFSSLFLIYRLYQNKTEKLVVKAVEKLCHRRMSVSFEIRESELIAPEILVSILEC